jgi:curved DNA-binding protein CbpA
MSRHKVAKDFYRLLQVSSNATKIEIKTAYRKLALSLHPDRNDGDKAKTKAFKEATEAYNILVDTERRRQYDIANGTSAPSGWHNKNRKRAPPSNYRKVYAPHAPPDGKWHDAQRHYDMHYGDGMYHDALKSAYKHAKDNGEFDYHSPLGKGFSFDTVGGKKAKGDFNPYSKADQGPASLGYEYEEAYISEAKQVMKRRTGVADMLYERRRQRLQFQDRAAATTTQRATSAAMHEPLNEQNRAGACIIM